jgi:DNA-binding IclR family transcriptional regulator
VSTSDLDVIADESRSAKEVARVLGLHPQTVYRLRADMSRLRTRPN